MTATEAEIMARFVADYLTLLDGRLDAIRVRLETDDIEAARVAVLSLESTTAMLGGSGLSAALHELRLALDTPSSPRRLALLARVESEAAAFSAGLRRAG